MQIGENLFQGRKIYLWWIAFNGAHIIRRPIDSAYSHVRLILILAKITFHFVFVAYNYCILQGFTQIYFC